MAAAVTTDTKREPGKPGMQAPWQQMIQVSRLHPNTDNPRKDPGDLAGLAASIRESGLKQRIIVRPAPDLGPDEFYIMDGWRRYLAMRDGWTAIPAEVQPYLSTDPARQDVIIALITDIHDKHLNPMERAQGCGQLRDLGMSASEISRVTGMHVSTVTNGLALLEFTDEDQARIASGELPVSEALKIIRRIRRIRRRRQGLPDRGTHWEPDHFTGKHPQARIARAMCDAREHTARRRLGSVACGQCFEDAIREDQSKIIEATRAARERFAAAMADRDGKQAAGAPPAPQEHGAS
jgi:ParB family chromosome partitioning protein